MKALLNSMITAEALAREVHWNARGKGFIAVHKYLDEVYDSCEEYIDEVAEHMVASGWYTLPQWEIEEFAHFPRNHSSIQEGLDALIPRLCKVVRNAEEFIKYSQSTESGEDVAGQDLATRIIQDFKKHIWFLDAELDA